MPNIIDAFVVTFGLDAKNFRSGERDVNEATKRLRESNKRTFDDMEARGKSAANTFKSVRNEVVGLGLAVMGASSIGGFVSGMMTGAASADRLGQSIGMTTKQVWSWRMAMRSVGGQVGDGDAAIQAVQRAKMGYRMGTLSPDQAGAYGRLGISGNDLKGSDAGTILRKLAGAQGKMDAGLYSSLLGQIGLPQSAIYFLQQGQDKAEKLLKQFEDDAAGQERLAKETEDLQKSMVELQNTIMKLLVPPLTTIANTLNTLIGNPGSGTSGGQQGDIRLAPSWAPQWVQNLLTVHRPGNGGTGSTLGTAQHVRGGDPITQFLVNMGVKPETALGIRAGIQAESRGNAAAVNPTSGAYGIGQWLGGRKRELFRRFGPNPGLAEQLQFLWWELNGGDHAGRKVLAEGTSEGALNAYVTKFMRPAAGAETTGDLRRGGAFLSSVARFRAARTGTNIHVEHMTVQTSTNNAAGLARDVKAQTGRRVAVATIDKGVNP